MGAAGVIMSDAEPGVVDAARANIRHAGAEVEKRACVVQLDMREQARIRELALAENITTVIGADLVYEAAALDVTAQAVAAALPCGGNAWLVLPTRYRTGMSCAGFAEALVMAGLEVVSARTLDHGDAHYVF